MENHLNELRKIIRNVISENENKYNVLDKKGSKIDWNDELENSLKKFEKDGNVSKKKDGSFSTQDTQYKNNLPTRNDLRAYFYKEFVD